MGFDHNVFRCERYVVVIDDDPIIPEIVASAIGFRAVSYHSLEDFQNSAFGIRPAAIIIDVNLTSEGDQDGLVALKLVRESMPDLPVIMITSSEDPNLIVKAFESGADDFVLKPLRVPEFRARFFARLMHACRVDLLQTTRTSDLYINFEGFQICGPTGCAELSNVELKLIKVLLRSQRSPISRSQLRQLVWKGQHVTENAIERQISSLRQILKEIGSTAEVKNQYGKGYRLG